MQLLHYNFNSNRAGKTQTIITYALPNNLQFLLFFLILHLWKQKMICMVWLLGIKWSFAWGSECVTRENPGCGYGYVELADTLFFRKWNAKLLRGLFSNWCGHWRHSSNQDGGHLNCQEFQYYFKGKMQWKRFFLIFMVFLKKFVV